MRSNNSTFQGSFSDLFGSIDRSINSEKNVMFVAKVVSIPESNVVGQIEFNIPGLDNQSTESEVATPKDPNSFSKPVVGSYIQIEAVQSKFFYTGIINYSDTDNLDIISDFLSPVETQTVVDDSADSYEDTMAAGGPIEEPSETTFVGPDSEIIPIIEKEGDNIIKGFHNNTLIFSYDEIGNSVTSIYINRQGAEYDINTHGISVFGEADVDSSQTFPDGFSSNKPSEDLGSAINLKSDKIRISSDAGSIFLSSAATIGIAAAQDINIDTQTKTTINSPEIYLGTGASEALVLGNKYDALMNELVDAILKMTVGTATGPSTPPINAAIFTKIKAKIAGTLSAVNKTN